MRPDLSMMLYGPRQPKNPAAPVWFSFPYGCTTYGIPNYGNFLIYLNYSCFWLNYDSIYSILKRARHDLWGAETANIAVVQSQVCSCGHTWHTIWVKAAICADKITFYLSSVGTQKIEVKNMDGEDIFVVNTEIICFLNNFNLHLSYSR